MPAPLRPGSSLSQALLPVALVLACAADPGRGAAADPSDDPDDWAVDPAVRWIPRVLAPRWVIPSDSLPAAADPDHSNNNVDIVLHGGRLFLAWRTAPTHWASEDTRMVVISSGDLGGSWRFEASYALGADLREPRFLSFRGRLHLHFFEGGTSLTSFTPRFMWRVERGTDGTWSAPERFGGAGEVPWAIKARRGRVFLSSYLGEHYNEGVGALDVLFRESADGLAWSAPEAAARVYRGGVSEVAFEFARDGTLWAVGRNEDGDETGFGSQICSAPPEAPASWTCLPRSDPERYDSPVLFRHGEEIYLLARRDLGGPFDLGRDELPFEERKRKYLVEYWLRPKRTSLYRLDTTQRRIVHLLDLPGAGDTAFPSVRRTGANTFLVANYTAPVEDPDVSWVQAQGSTAGTAIYLVDLEFVPAP